MQKRAIAFVVVGFALLAGLFFVFRPDGEMPPSAQQHDQVTDPTTPESHTQYPPSQEPPADGPRPLVFELVLENGRIASGPARIQVPVDTLVEIQFQSNQSDTVHLHGYDIERELRPGEIALMRFVANRSGRFEIELHHGHHAIAALEVSPRL